MLYFQISVSPVILWGEEPLPGNSLAHVMVDETDLESAASRVVKRLYADRWRIVTVHHACSVKEGERFRRNDLMAEVLRDAENVGFAYRLDPHRDSLPNEGLELEHDAARGEAFANR